MRDPNIDPSVQGHFGNKLANTGCSRPSNWYCACAEDNDGNERGVIHTCLHCNSEGVIDRIWNTDVRFVTDGSLQQCLIHEDLDPPGIHSVLTSYNPGTNP